VRLGLCSRTGTAVAVALGEAGTRATLAGRWSLDLTDGLVPRQAYHSAADLPRPEAEILVRRAIDTVTEVATARLAEVVAAAGAVDAVGVIVGDHPVPDSLSAILAAHTLMHAAEGQLYRDALLDAAAALGLRAVGLARRQAESRLAGDLADAIVAVGRAAGPPWRREHKLAAVAALAVP
jgi:hypothetical protein